MSRSSDALDNDVTTNAAPSTGNPGHQFLQIYVPYEGGETALRLGKIDDGTKETVNQRPTGASITTNGFYFVSAAGVAQSLSGGPMSVYSKANLNLGSTGGVALASVSVGAKDIHVPAVKPADGSLAGPVTPHDTFVEKRNKVYNDIQEANSWAMAASALIGVLKAVLGTQVGVGITKWLGRANMFTSTVGAAASVVQGVRASKGSVTKGAGASSMTTGQDAAATTADERVATATTAKSSLDTSRKSFDDLSAKLAQHDPSVTAADVAAAAKAAQPSYTAAVDAQKKSRDAAKSVFEAAHAAGSKRHASVSEKAADRAAAAAYYQEEATLAKLEADPLASLSPADQAQKSAAAADWQRRADAAAKDAAADPTNPWLIDWLAKTGGAAAPGGRILDAIRMRYHQRHKVEEGLAEQRRLEAARKTYEDELAAATTDEAKAAAREKLAAVEDTMRAAAVARQQAAADEAALTSKTAALDGALQARAQRAAELDVATNTRTDAARRVDEATNLRDSLKAARDVAESNYTSAKSHYDDVLRHQGAVYDQDDLTTAYDFLKDRHKERREAREGLAQAESGLTDATRAKLRAEDGFRDATTRMTDAETHLNEVRDGLVAAAQSKAADDVRTGAGASRLADAVAAKTKADADVAAATNAIRERDQPAAPKQPANAANITAAATEVASAEAALAASPGDPQLTDTLRKAKEKEADLRARQRAGQEAESNMARLTQAQREADVNHTLEKATEQARTKIQSNASQLDAAIQAHEHAVALHAQALDAHAASANPTTRHALEQRAAELQVAAAHRATCEQDAHTMAGAHQASGHGAGARAATAAGVGSAAFGAYGAAAGMAGAIQSFNADRDEAPGGISLVSDQSVFVGTKADFTAVASSGINMVVPDLGAFTVVAAAGISMQSLLGAEIFGIQSASLEGGFSASVVAAGEASLVSRHAEAKIAGTVVKVGESAPEPLAISKLYGALNPFAQMPTATVQIDALGLVTITTATSKITVTPASITVTSGTSSIVVAPAGVTVTSASRVSVTAPNISLTGKTSITGDVSITGKTTMTGDVTIIGKGSSTGVFTHA